VKRAPTQEAIAAAEAKLAVSRQKTRDGLDRARTAIRASFTRPSTIALAVGAAGLAGVAGVWLARRPRRRRAAYRNPKLGVGAVLTAYAAPFVQSLLARYGKEALSMLVEKMRAARHARAEAAAAEASNRSIPDGPPIGVAH
jgi:hypothetical protein